MYEEYFGLSELPFGITPDTSFFFACNSYQEALNTLLIAIRNGEGFIKVTGEVGTGKTLLCRKFMAMLGDGDYITAYIPNPYLTPHSLLLALTDELELYIDSDADQNHLLTALNLALMALADKGKRIVICLDEAQAMPMESLEALRLLTNLETEKRKLLQVVLFGQPELNTNLEHESIRQLKQRITFHYELPPLSKEELNYYLMHRLSVAGHRSGPLFSQGALNLLYRASGGVPRLVNILAHKSLMVVYGEGCRSVSSRHVKTALKDTPAARHVPLFWRCLAIR
ncbi:MAG: AAA family ATPase [Sulfuricellaceae bacterium]|nr:AAA family ATPase [Sulfuricellaceae bacterium]